MSPVQPHDLYYIKYTDDFQSFVDISLIGIIIYVTTEIYIAFFRPTEEVNLSVVWCAMIIMYGISALSSIAINYLRTDEASLLYIFAGLSFILSLIVQLGDTKFFEFHLKDAFRNFTTTSLSLIQSHIDSQTATASTSQSTTGEKSTTTQKIYSQIKTYSTNELLFTISIAVVSGFIGAILFFPSFRLARLHFLCLKYSQGSKLKKFAYYLNFLFPLLVSMCWFRPSFSSTRGKHSNETNTTDETISETAKQFLNLVTVSNQTNSSSYFAELRQASSKAFVDVLTADNLRIYLVLIVFVLRLSLYTHYAQSYLNLAFELATSLRKSTTKLTNVKYMTTISSIYQYYGVVATQYVMPAFILLFLVFMLKTLGDFSWCGGVGFCNEFVDSVANYTSSLKSGYTSSPNILKTLETATFNITSGHNALNKIFTPLVLRSIVGYFTFWTASIWFIISCFGLLYYQYIDRQVVLLDS